MAETTGQPFSVERLTADPAYNARLGTAYLQDLRDRFGEATVLVVAGYNAGPGRPQRWVDAIGDPRGARMDPVDWIEMIPFDETRNYVMRVTESLAPYRARLAGKPVSLTLGDELAAPAWDGAPPAPGRRPAAVALTPPVVPVTRAATP
jgi:soluble lytic murein transglycosylase